MHGKADPVVVLGKHVWALRLGAYILAGYGLVQSLAIILGGDSRFSAPGYRTALQVPGAPPVWGWFLLAFAVVAFWGVRSSSYHVGKWAMFAMAVWSFFFALSFGISAARDPNANLTAVVVYAKDGILFTLVSVAYRYTKKETIREDSPGS